MSRPFLLRHLIFLFLLTVLTTAAYSNSFHAPFVLDDFVSILNKKSIRLFTPDISGIINAATEGDRSHSGKRWLPNLSFAINYYFSGSNVWSYHLVNLIIHIGCAFFFYLLGHTTLIILAGNKIGADRLQETAMIAALLWAVHPLQTNAVTYIVQRMTSLSAFFSLIAIFCYIKTKFYNKFTIKFILYCGCIFSSIMAVISKENALILPLLIMGSEFYFSQKISLHKQYKKLFFYVGFSIGTIVFVSLIFLGGDIFSYILNGYKYRNFTLLERLLTESRIIFYYLSLLAYPSPTRLNLIHEVGLSRSLLDPPQTVLALLSIVFLIGLVAWTFNRNRLFSFALFWFLGNLIIESTVVPLELMYEHRLYLPSMFLFLSGTSFLFHLAPTRPWLSRIPCLLIIILLAFWTWQRNLTWASSISLWSDVVAKSPGLSRGYNNLGVAYHEANDFRSAEGQFQKAIQIDPDSRIAYVGLASMYITQNRLAEAEQILHTALTKETYLDPARIYHYLGVLYRKEGRHQEAISFSQRALHHDKDNLEPMLNLGIVYEQMGDYARADATFAEALRLGLNDSVDLYNNWGIAVFKMGATDRAIGYFQRGLQLDPDHPETRYNLGLAYGQKGMLKEAQAEMQRAMLLQQKQN